MTMREGRGKITHLDKANDSSVLQSFDGNGGSDGPLPQPVPTGDHRALRPSREPASCCESHSRLLSRF
jgi:hypothetical protein